MRCSEWRRAVAVAIGAPRGRRRRAWVVDAVAGFARHFGRRHDDTVMAVRADESAKRITTRTGFVTETQLSSGMSGGKFFDELEHVIMRAVDQTVTAHFARIARSQGDGDGIVMHVQTGEQNSNRGPEGGSSEDL